MFEQIQQPTRKIIHVDMDCFYAAIEIRDNPALANKPVAVGGAPDKRGVICTCNYVARKYGVHSAMATASAYRRCRDLIVLPVNIAKYKQVAKRIHAIFREFTDLVEPLSLDEAYLDVTDAMHCRGSATLIAKEIRKRIWDVENLTASAGVAPNKFLAKIASGWKKPNGLFVIRPAEIENFIKNLAVDELFGVGKVTAEKLHNLGLKTCTDLQKFSLNELTDRFGKFGQQLYNQCRGIDHRSVNPNRIRKSLSVERTFPQDIDNLDHCLQSLAELYIRLEQRIHDAAPNHPIKNQFIKIKFNDFKLTTVEVISTEINIACYQQLLREVCMREQKAIRLLGLGVHFGQEIKSIIKIQPALF
jgi:DNA polymerase IV